MKAQFKIEITKHVRYDGRPRQIDKVIACDTLRDLVRALDAQGGIRLAKGDEERGFDQYGGYLVTWQRLADDEMLFACRCGCREVVKRDGGFRPGHDARLVGSLLYRVRERIIKRDEALDSIADRPALQAKLVRLLDNN